LYLAQSTNTAIAQYLLYDTEISGTSHTPETPTTTLPVSGSKPETDLSTEAQEMFEIVVDALEDGYSDTKIIQELMGYKGRGYGKGKTVLNEIKRFIDLDN